MLPVLDFPCVVAKELRTLLRSRKAFLTLMLVLVAAGGSFVLMWQTGSNLGGILGRAQVARWLYRTLSSVQIFAFALISVVFTATSITSERERKTLDLLLASGLSRAGVLVGKWISCIAYQFLVFLCLLPRRLR